MGTIARELGVKAIERITRVGFNAVGGARGLGVMVAPAGTKSWVLRVSINGKRRHIGLGPLREVTLAHARERALVLRNQIREGIDPLEHRRVTRLQAALDAAKTKTFDDCANEYIAAHESGWKNAKHGQQWRNTLETYATPKIGALPVQSIDRSHVLGVLQPLWKSKTETASRLRSRIELVLSYAMQAGYRPDGPNPATWRGGLDALLPAAAKVAKKSNHKAVPVREAPAFFKRLQQQDGVGARALAFTMLTGARSGEVRGATWAEVTETDAGPVWVVPPERMKAGKPHRVPLPQAAFDLLGKRGKPDALLFPAPRGGTLSDMTLSAVMKRMGVDAVPHGLRSTLRDWCAERNVPREVAEALLAHVVQGVEGSYFRSDLLEQRRTVLTAYAGYLAGA